MIRWQARKSDVCLLCRRPLFLQLGLCLSVKLLKSLTTAHDPSLLALREQRLIAVHVRAKLLLFWRESFLVHKALHSSLELQRVHTHHTVGVKADAAL